MKTTIKLPASENKDKILAIKISKTEQAELKKFCLKHKINQTDLVRYSLKSLLPIFNKQLL